MHCTALHNTDEETKEWCHPGYVDCNSIIAHAGMFTRVFGNEPVFVASYNIVDMCFADYRDMKML